MNTKILYLWMAGFMTLSVANGQEATSWRGPESSGIYTDSGLLKTWPASGPVIAWHFDELGEGFSSPAFANNKIYLSGTSDSTGCIYALSLDGKLLWKVSYGEEWIENYPGSRSTPTVVNDKLYIYSGKGLLTCMDANNGAMIWKKDIMKEYEGRNITWGVTESLVVDGDKIFVSPGGVVHNIIALNRQNGELIWSSKGVGEISAYCTPLLVKLASRKLLVTMMEKHIVGLDAETGVLLWSFEQTNQWSVHANTPLLYNNSLFCFSGYGQGGVKLILNGDGSKVTKAWDCKTFDSRMGGAVVVNGYIYGSGDKTRAWQCIDWTTGTQKYADQTVAKGNIISADGLLFLYSERGELALVTATPDSFKVTGQTKVELGSAQHWAHLVINKGLLYVRHGKSLIVYKIK